MVAKASSARDRITAIHAVEPSRPTAEAPMQQSGDLSCFRVHLKAGIRGAQPIAIRPGGTRFRHRRLWNSVVRDGDARGRELSRERELPGPGGVHGDIHEAAYVRWLLNAIRK